MLLPMIPLASGVTILDEHTSLTRLVIDVAPLLFAALGTAVGRHFSQRMNFNRIECFNTALSYIQRIFQRSISLYLSSVCFNAMSY
jgi:hypothetical protein